MNIEQIKNALPEYAKDIKLNLGNVLTLEGAPGLNEKHIASIALASAYAARNETVIAGFLQEAKAKLSPEEVNGAKTAAVIMAMNNVYYRFIHYIEDQAYTSMPAKLRMTIMANSGTDKITFELCSLAVSALNGCSTCMKSHALQLEKHGVSKEAVQSVVRIAAIINAASIALETIAREPVAA